MQVGIDVGATKIESVVLEENGQEKHRSRTSCPKDYLSIVNAIKAINSFLISSLPFLLFNVFYIKKDYR